MCLIGNCDPGCPSWLQDHDRYRLALRTSGLTATVLFDGATTGQRFRDAMASDLAPVLVPGDVFILDDFGAHKVAPCVRLSRRWVPVCSPPCPAVLTQARSSRPLPSSGPCCVGQPPAPSPTFMPLS